MRFSTGQCRRHDSPQVGQIDRFTEQPSRRPSGKIGFTGGISRQQNDRKPREAGANVFGKFQPCSITEASIKEDEPWRPVLDQVQRNGGRESLSDCVAFLCQNSAKHLAKDGIVLYDQNGRWVRARMHQIRHAPLGIFFGQHLGTRNGAAFAMPGDRTETRSALTIIVRATCESMLPWSLMALGSRDEDRFWTW